MSREYDYRRKKLVRREGQLMDAYTEAHKRGDAKAKNDVQEHIDKNIAQRGMLKRGAY